MLAIPLVDDTLEGLTLLAGIPVNMPYGILSCIVTVYLSIRCVSMFCGFFEVKYDGWKIAGIPIIANVMTLWKFLILAESQ